MIEEQTETTETPTEKSGAYVRRTREVLTTQLREAAKVQKDTRVALLEVWKDLQTDIRGQLSSFEASAKKKAESLRDQLPFVGGKAKAEETAKTEEPAS